MFPDSEVRWTALDIALEKAVEKITGCWLGMPRRFDRRFGFDLGGGDSQEHLN